ncbi:MAG: hypothetical protein PUI85_01670 [Eubacteriales bacterium]|nr:hypothetical protein [Eubacteriales bacterium]MDY3332901.1 hypothetical protein [Gallibacter sp.]
MTKTISKGILAIFLSISMILSSLVSVGFAQENASNNIDPNDLSIKSISKEMVGYYRIELNSASAVTNVTGVAVDGADYQKKDTYVKGSDINKYFINTLGGNNYIDLAPFDGMPVITLKTAKGTYNIKITKNSSIFGVEFDKNIEFKPVEGSGAGNTQGDEPGNSNPVESGSNTSDDENDISLVDDAEFSFFKAKITPNNVNEQISTVEINHIVQEKKDSKYTTFNGGYYIGKKDEQDENVYLYINEPADNTIVKIVTKDDKKFTFKYVKANAKGERFVKITEQEGKMKFLKARLVGNFEGALVNQKKYDAIAGASGSVTTNKNSNVELQVAEVDNENDEVKDDQWKLLKDLDNFEVDKSKTKINLDEASGMRGVYSPYDSSITLSGIPAKKGEYPVTVTLADKKGRIVKTNALKFNVYTENEKLSDFLKIDNCKKYDDGTYSWDMEPWFIRIFNGGDEIVTVPNKIKTWYGSHTSGTYGELGYYVDNEPEQTLVIDDKTDLTLVNMKVKSSVKILVKNGGKLKINDSSIYGKIVVENGGFLQVNYDPYNKKFIKGSSINGQIVLEEGATLGSSMIYSNANALTDGKPRKVKTPVVKVIGNANIDGNVYIKGDESPTGTDPDTEKAYAGQPAMEVENATLNIAKDSTLGVYGGGKKATTTNGGNALILNHGRISGEGKLVAVAGSGFMGDGGDAVSGNGIIDVASAYLQGGNTYSKSQQGGKPYGENVKVAKNTIGKALNGKVLSNVGDDDQPAYWDGILEAPNTENLELGNQPINKDEVNPTSTLKEKTIVAHGVSLTALLDEKAQLIVEKLDESNTDKRIIDFIKTMNGKNKLDNSFDVSVKGKYEAPIKLVLPVGDKTAKKVTVLHLKGDEIETFVRDVIDGVVEIEIESLSPFAIAVEDKQVNSEITVEEDNSNANNLYVGSNNQKDNTNSINNKVDEKKLSKDNKTIKDKTPSTNDLSNILLNAILLLISFSIIMAFIVRKKNINR